MDLKLPSRILHSILDPLCRFFIVCTMGAKQKGGCDYIMADRHRGTMYVGVTTNLAARIDQHRTGDGSDFCRRYDLTRLVWAEFTSDILDAIEHEKRVKRWRREWKFALIEAANSDWKGLSAEV